MALILIGIMLSTTACNVGNDALKGTGNTGHHGTVVRKLAINGRYKMYLRRSDGSTDKTFVKRTAYRKCSIGEYYPNCGL